MALYIGLMSGTSMDGIDAALVDLPSHQLIHGVTGNYSEQTKAALAQAVNKSQTTLENLCQLNTLIGRDFAKAANTLLREAELSAKDIRAIGSHGQTLCHNTKAVIPYTLQLGCGHTLSSLTGIDVVADFRTRDLVNGGQGAPFAPLYHQELFSKYKENTAIVNIGGIANLTFLNPNQPTSGWDVGPGNCLMDSWINLHCGKKYDEQGCWASQGEVIPVLLDRLLSDPFFSQAHPKSIGKEYFSLNWLERNLNSTYEAKDVQKTLLELTSTCIAQSISNSLQPSSKVFLCGGGTHNLELHKSLKQLLPDSIINSVSSLGVDPDYLEAMMFAWLASQSINLIPVDLQTITGSSRQQILGAIYPTYP